jgi:hypothetical protein
MEKSKMFRNAQFVSENDMEAASRSSDQDPKKFNVQAEYVPSTEQPSGSGSEIAAEGGK